LNLQGKTKNQHFISRSEQKLNAANPEANDTNKSIYEFLIEDKENHSISLASNKPKKIEKSLSLHDLYSFDVCDKAVRLNFEKIFHRYEHDIAINTIELLRKIEAKSSDVKHEVLNVFVSKVANFIRNPYSIKKVINTFPSLKGLQPTDPVMYKNFEKIINGKKPHQSYLCDSLGITQEDYVEWLSIVFLMLTEFSEDVPTMIESMVKDMYECKNTFVMVCVYTYSEHVCLLSDRGYSIPLPEEEHLAWDFNLTKNSFIRYIFSDIEKISPEGTNPKIIDSWRKMPKNIQVHHKSDELGSLKQYNQHVVYQSHKHVLSATKCCFGL
jgi:hypothetical protein